MGSAKYKVYQVKDGSEQFLGHYAGATPQIAAEKAVKANFETRKISRNDIIDVRRIVNGETIHSVLAVDC